MIHSSNVKRRSAFSWWLRTGHVPRVDGPAGIELKFNPWHDPADGRFTFAGEGQHYGATGRDATGTGGGRARVDPGPAAAARDRGQAAGTTMALPVSDASMPRPAKRSERPLAQRGAGAGRSSRLARLRSGHRPHPGAEFIGGVGEGFADVAKETAASVRETLTTNPVTTVRNVGRGIAGMIDDVIAAEDTPARVQVRRAADAVAGASAREIGRAAATATGNLALGVAPGAAVARVSALRRLRTARPRETFDPPQIGWVKENVGRDKPWKPYNDGAPGARPGRAPTLMRTMPDGSRRPVKFDGIQGEYVVDRKWKVIDAPHARAQLLRQSQVLAEHRLLGTWEVPNELQKIRALKLFRRMNVTNIKVRIVKP